MEQQQQQALVDLQNAVLHRVRHVLQGKVAASRASAELAVLRADARTLHGLSDMQDDVLAAAVQQLAEREAAAAAAGRTVFEALNDSLPQGTMGLSRSSSTGSSLPDLRLQPEQVLAWKHVEPQGQADLDEAILGVQAAADKQDRRLARPPARLREPMDSEAEVAGWLQAWVADPLGYLVQHKGATWKQLPPSDIIQEAFIHSGADGVEGQQAAAVTTSSGRLSRRPSATAAQPQDSTFSRSRHKMDFALLVQEQASEAVQPSSKRRCVCVGEVKKPGELLKSVEDLPDLVAAFQPGSDRQRQAAAALSQIYTYLQLSRMCYGFISCWFATWLVYCPPQQRGVLYVSRPFSSSSSSSAAPAATVLGALAWLQHQALQVAPGAVDAYTPPATGQAGAREGSPGSSGPDDGALPGSEEEWVPDQRRPHDQHGRGSGGRSGGAGGSSSKSRQPRGMVTLLLQHKLQQGSAGVVVAGMYGGLPAVVKLLGPDRHGLAAFQTESTAYSMLAAVQGTLVPRLLGTGSLPGGVVFLATSRVDGAPLSSLPTVPAATAKAALEALARLHREHEGFLHNDIRLANLVVLAGSGRAVSPQCMLLDFGRSRLNGSKAEQHREFMALKKLLGV